MERTPLVIGNWKMNGSASQVDEFAAEFNRSDEHPCELGICVPFVYVERMARAVSGSHVRVGAQNVAATIEPGAQTGEVNARMLTDVGASDVIVGHSERRAGFNESDTTVVAKISAAIDAGLRPILCVGETKQERDAGRFQQVIDGQLHSVLSNFESDQLASMVIAYEPVWAIGTGDTASADQAEEAHHYIRGRIAEVGAALADGCRIIYGGSVKPNNAGDIFSQPNVDGALVGGASLKFDAFAAIAAASVDPQFHQNNSG